MAALSQISTSAPAAGGIERPEFRAATRADELRNLLADEIMRGRLAPGMPLEELEIARRFGVSRTPVREAIRQLAASGLVEARPHRSAIVTRPSSARLRAMFSVLSELEALCAGLAAVAMTDEERRQLEVLHARLAELAARRDPQRFHAMNEQFHGAIYAGSHNEYLAEVTFATRRRLSPFSHLQFHAAGRLTLASGEHARVVDAILRGDRDAAAAEMRAHIVSVEMTFERYVEGA